MARRACNGCQHVFDASELVVGLGICSTCEKRIAREQAEERETVACMKACKAVIMADQTPDPSVTDFALGWMRNAFPEAEWNHLRQLVDALSMRLTIAIRAELCPGSGAPLLLGGLIQCAACGRTYQPEQRDGRFFLHNHRKAS